MGYLTRNDVTAVMDCVGDLHAGTANPDFTAYAVQSVSRLIPSGIALYIALDLKTNSSAFVPHPSGAFPPSFLNDFKRHLHQHPAYHRQAMKYLPIPPNLKVRFRKGYFGHLVQGRAVTDTDAQSRRDYLNSGLYWELFKHHAIEFQMGTSFIHTESRLEAVCFVRDRRDFSEREREMLDLLGPHFRQCFSLNRQFTSRSKDLGANGTQPLFARMEGYRLTDREAEVLHWVAQGKSNADIAEILGMATGTVKKHLEHIFPKLGVENRMSAALMAMEAGGN